MAVKVFIKRKFKADGLKDGYQLLTQARYNVMKRAGYISSETLSDIEDPNKVVVISMWNSLEDWNRWVSSETRTQIEAQIEKLLDTSTEYEMYNLGVQF